MTSGMFTLLAKVEARWRRTIVPNYSKGPLHLFEWGPFDLGGRVGPISIQVVQQRLPYDKRKRVHNKCAVNVLLQQSIFGQVDF